MTHILIVEDEEKIASLLADYLAKAGYQLARKTISTRPVDESGDYSDLPLMSEVKYKKREGRIVYTFNPKIVPHLIGLREKFTKYPLKKAVDFQSSYTWRFYEILASWAKPKNQTNGLFAGWIRAQSVEELREMLGVPASYSWQKFNTRVIGVAQAELKEKARIKVSVRTIKTGRKITNLDIDFIEDDQQQLPLEGGATKKK